MSELPDLMIFNHVNDANNKLLLFGPVLYSGLVQTIDFYASHQIRLGDRFISSEGLKYEVVNDVQNIQALNVPALMAQIMRQEQPVLAIQLREERS